MRIGALLSLATGDYRRPRTQAWAWAIYEDPPVARQRINGVYYDAAHSNGPVLALWNTESRIEMVNGAGGKCRTSRSRIRGCGRASSMPRSAWVCARIERRGDTFLARRRPFSLDPWMIAVVDRRVR